MILGPIVTVDIGNWTRFVNHECKNFNVEALVYNCREWSQRKYTTWYSLARVHLVAVHDIEVGNEITVDYGKSFWNSGLECCQCSTCST